MGTKGEYQWYLTMSVSATAALGHFSIQVQCSKAREVNFQFSKLFAVVLDTHIKCVDKVHKRIDPTLVMLPLN